MRLTKDFFQQDVLEVAPKLLGKRLIRVYDDGTKEEYIITETEAYRGEEDLASHASKGRTPRTEVMYHEGGVIYVYLIYGMYWMLNFVTGEQDDPQAVLIRGMEKINGPGRLTKKLQIDKSFYNENLASSKRIWIENGTDDISYTTGKRVGIDYAKEWKHKHWRFILK